MFFSKKGKLKKKYDEELMNQFLASKDEWSSQKRIFESAYSPTKEIEYGYKLAEAKYFWLLKEAKQRNLSMR